MSFIIREYERMEATKTHTVKAATACSDKSMENHINILHITTLERIFEKEMRMDGIIKS